MYRSKAKHLKATAQILVDKYDSQVPKDKKTLMTLPGVGEKTANVVLAEGYGVPAIAVDTHVSRISKKFHIVDEKATPHEVEKRLESILPKDEWIKTHHAMILFGRYTMPSRAKGDPYSYLNSKKFHIVDEKATPHEVEKRLESVLPKDEWIKTHHAMILFGRYTMPSRAKGDPYSYLNSQK